MTERAFEREVRIVIVGGLATLLFLAGTAVVVLRNTAAWGGGENLRRLTAETRAVADRLGGSPDPALAFVSDAPVTRLLRELNARGAALYDARGDRLAEASFLPDAGLAPGALPPGERPAPDPVVAGADGGTPSITIALPGATRILRVAWDGTPSVEARRNARILSVAVPAAAGVLVLLVVPFLRRLAEPIDALTETAKGAGGLVPAARAGGDEAETAIATFQRTVEELKKRTGELEGLRRSEQRRADDLAVTAETLVRSHPGGLVVVDAAGRLTRANAPARDLLSLGEGSLAAGAEAAIEKVPALRAAVEAARTGSPTLSLELTIGKGADARLVELTAVPILDSGKSILGVLLFLEDRTSTRRLERELSSRRELAALGEMSAGIAHEFRNATGTILGWARLAAKTGDPVARGRQLDAIQAEAEHVARVTGDFLFFARPEQLEAGPCDLRALAFEIAEEQRVLTPGVRVEATGTFAPAIADPALVRRALVNLVKNACEAAAAGGRAGRVVVRGEGATGGFARIAVEDDGPGVSAEAAGKLFVPFYSTKDTGTGLGLALVAKIALLHGGAVTVERSPELSGARFVLTLPAAP
ncbi:MAG: ATP-binding protein [Acidobacteriota bacterium]